MNPFAATCVTFAVGLAVILCLVAWSAAWAIAAIWAINILGGSLEYNWQTVVAIMVIFQIINSMFPSFKKKEQNK